MIRRTIALAALGMVLGGMAPVPAHAQFGKLKDKLKQRAEEKVDQKVDCTLDKYIDKKECKPASAGASAGAGGGASTSAGAGASAGGEGAVAKPDSRPGEGAWANFDFVPGGKPLYVDDFSKDRVGNFPKRMELHNGTFEVVEWQGKRWIRSDGDGTFTINVPGGLPERWTLELDLTVPWHGWYVYPGEPIETTPHSTMSYINLGVTSGVKTVKGTETEFDIRNGFGARLFYICKENCSAHDIERGASTDEGSSITRPFRFRIHADGAYMKVYLDEKRIFNLPNMGRWTGTKLNFHFRSNPNQGNQQGALMGNVSLNAGGKDMYDALSEDGRLALQGIYFDTGSDKVRAESSGTLSEIAAMMEEHPELKILIEGHTDNVGDAAANQSLSEKRAAAVVAALSGGQYKVGADRLKSIGFGASKPAKGNDSAEGRQANRRVELVVQK